MRYPLFALVGISLAVIGLITNTGCDQSTTEVAPNGTEAADGTDHSGHDHGEGAHEDGDHAHEDEGEDVHITAADVERPANYADALVRVTAYCDAIRQACSDGKPGNAHRPLDELTFVLGWLPAIARDGGIDKSHWETINVNAQTMSERYEELHLQIDAGEGVDYDAIAADVDAAIAAISSVPTAEPETADGDS